MGTFLTTSKMSPALAARVEAAVTGRPAGRGKLSPRVTALLRVGAVAAVIAFAWSIVRARRTSIDELESDRRTLLAQIDEHASKVTPEDLSMPAQIEAWLGQHSGPYEGDLVADSVRDKDALAAVLHRPMVYVRGSLGGFASTRGIAEMGPSTFRDAFVLCLIDPPEKRAEKPLKDKARAALTGGDRVKAAAHVERLHAALAGVPFLSPAYKERVRDAEMKSELVRMNAELKLAPLADAARAMKARLLLAVMDEPKEDFGPTEIDGACKHHARVMLVDLDGDKVLLRQRKLLDPAWISADVRTDYASGINSCELALEVREAIVAPR
ncbi:MAG: hypothetical protein U0359_37015 [Byssovorax sp.]